MISLMDIEIFKIPDQLNLLLLIPTLISAINVNGLYVWDRFLGAIVISLPMLVIALILKDSFGGGDIKLYFFAGFFLKVEGIISTFIFMVISSGIFVLISFLKKEDRKKKIPLAPFISFGIILVLLQEDLFL